jgi:hypothetical protein
VVHQPLLSYGFLDLLQICNMLLLIITSLVFVESDLVKPRGVVEESLFVAFKAVFERKNGS